MESQNFPIPTVGAIIVNPEQQILIVQSHKWLHKWAIPGGKIHVGESSEEALKREIKEETNLDIDRIQFVLYQDSIHSIEFYKKIHFIFLNYICHTSDISHLQLNDEAQHFEWLTVSEALNKDLNLPTRLLIESIQNMDLS
jgi:phosphoglycolate phosphatase